MSNLKEYPSLIHSAAERVAHHDREISMVKLSMARQEAKADERTAFDASLKNEAQRTARRNTMLGDNYNDQALDLVAMKHERTMLAAELQHLENGFKVAVLEIRLTIAQLPAID